MLANNTFCTNCGLRLDKVGATPPVNDSFNTSDATDSPHYTEEDSPLTAPTDRSASSYHGQSSSPSPVHSPRYQPAYSPYDIPKQYNRIAAALLAIFLGGLGVHKFYLNKGFQGALYILLAFTGISVVLGILDGIRFLSLSNEHFYEYSTR